MNYDGEEEPRREREFPGTTLEMVNRLADPAKIDAAFGRIDLPMVKTLTIATMQSMALVMHHPEPDDKTIRRQKETTIALAEHLFHEWDRSGLTEEVTRLAPVVLSLNRYARAALQSLEQEFLSPLAIPAEGWNLIWDEYDYNAADFRAVLQRHGSRFRFSDHGLPALAQHITERDRAYDVQVEGGNRVVGIGARFADRSATQRPSPATEESGMELQQSSLTQWPPPGCWPEPWPGPWGASAALTTQYPRPWYCPPWGPGTGPTFPIPPQSPFLEAPTVFHYSPWNWRAALTTAVSVVIGAVNTTAAVPTAGVAVASVATAAAVGGWWAGGGQ